MTFSHMFFRIHNRIQPYCPLLSLPLLPMPSSSQLVSLLHPAPPLPPPGLIRVAYRSTHEGFLGHLASGFTPKAHVSSAFSNH